MTDAEREAAADRWLARNLAVSRRLDEYRDPDRWTRVLVALTAIDRREHTDTIRHDRVA
jgi:hypothetical protein